MVTIYPLPIKATRLLAENIVALLDRENFKQHDLAQWCRKSDPWVSQFLRGERNWQLDDLDRVADMFGLQTYQLFLPGVAQRTERRSGIERRSVKTRRVGQAQQFIMNTAKEIDDKHPRRRLPHVAASSPLMEAIDRIVTDANKRITAAVRQFADTRDQAAAPRKALPAKGKSRRAPGGSDA